VSKVERVEALELLGMTLAHLDAEARGELSTVTAIVGVTSAGSSATAV